MTLLHGFQGGFNSGELSPYLLGRTDLPEYDFAARLIENWIIRPEGSLIHRPGTRFVREVPDSSEKARLIPFIFSTEQAYVIELSDLLARFYRDEGIIESGGSPVTLVLPYLEAELFDLHFTQSADVLYVAHPSHHPRTISRTSHTAWTTAILDLQDGPYLELRVTSVGATPLASTVTLNPGAASGSGVALVASSAVFDTTRDVNRMVRLEHGSTWGAARIVSVSDTQNATIDIKKDFGGTGATGEWRLGAWYVDNYPRTVSFFQQRLAFASTPEEAERIDASQSGDFTDFGPSETDGTVVDSNALSLQVGGAGGAGQIEVIRWINPLRNPIFGTDTGVRSILASSQNEAITPTNIHTVRSSVAGSGSLQAINAANAVLYKSRCGCKLFGASYSFENDGYDPEDLTILADHIAGGGFVELTSQPEPHKIVWAVRADGRLAALTFLPERKVLGWHRHRIGGSFGAGIAVVESAASIPAPDDMHYQVWMIVKRTINGATKRYVEFMEEEFREGYDEEQAFFVDSGLSLDGAAVDVGGNPTDPATITGITQADPGVVTTSAAHNYSNGDLVRLTHVVGMTEVNRKSYKVANKTATTFELTHAVTGADIDTSGFSAYVSGGEARKKATTISGLSHLEGETVGGLADGAPFPPQAVSSGAITLQSAASEVHVGLLRNADLWTLPFESQGSVLTRGAEQQKAKRITEAVIRIDRTIGLSIGKDSASLVPEPFRRTGDPMDEPPPLQTKLLRVPVTGGHGREVALYVRQAHPLPAAILSIAPTVGVGPR